MNPQFRYLLIPACITLWSTTIFDLRLDLSRHFKAILCIQLLVVLLAPGNLLQRTGLRYYNYQLKNEFTSVLPQNVALFGSYKYIKLFDFNSTPFYAFMAYRNSTQYQYIFQNASLNKILGSYDDILKEVQAQGFVPIAIYPDIPFSDNYEPYKINCPMPSKVLACVNMAKYFGPLSRFLPEEKKMITIYQLMPR